MDQSLKARTVANLGYNTICRLIVFILSSATGIILARHLSSSDYGVVGFAMIFIGFLQQFNDLGITSSIVQKETIQDDELYTAFTLKLILGFLIFSASYAWACLSEKAFDNPAVKWVVVILAAGLFINGLGFLPTTLLTRQLKFKLLTIPQIGSRLVATTVSIAAVYLGFRYWSIVLSNVAANIATVAIVWMLCPLPWKFRWDSRAAKEHLKFGSHLFLAGLMIFAMFNADNFIIGTAGGAAILGFYSIAFNWSTKVTDFIGQSIHSILLSTFSRVQHDAEKLKHGYLTILEYVSFAAILANVLLLVISKDLLVMVLGAGSEKWLPALAAMKVLCIYGIIRTIWEPIGSMLVTVRRPGLIFKCDAFVAAVEIACIYPALKYFGIAGVAVVVTLSYTVQFPIALPALRREIGLGYWTALNTLRPALASGCVLAIFGLAIDMLMRTCWLSLVLKLIVGSILYLGTYGIVTNWKMLKEAREIISLALPKISRPAV